MKFFLGTHMPNWLTLTTVPLFICDRRLRDRKTLPVARGTWSVDSGGFTELQKYGSWDHGPSPEQYAAQVRRYRDEIGGLVWAAPQDWMCEPLIIHGGIGPGGLRFAGTKLSVPEHQAKTVANVIHLRSIADDLPFIPVLQGFTQDEYLTCVDRYHEAGIDLASEPTVGLGSVCRRQATNEAADIIQAIRDTVPGIRLHGFGIKTAGLGAYGSSLASSDSLAWSYDARRDRILLPGCTSHKNCASCPKFAFRWREKVLASLGAHATRARRQRPSKNAEVSRKLDGTHAVQLALSAFRNEAARLERDATIRWAHRDGHMSVRAIAARTGLSPSRVGQIVAEPDRPLADELRERRQHWGVDNDPATRAVADHIVANLVSDDLAGTT